VKFGSAVTKLNPSSSFFNMQFYSFISGRKNDFNKTSRFAFFKIKYSSVYNRQCLI